MSAVSLKTFGGQNLRLSPKLLQSQQATAANNCRFLSGNLRAWNAPLFVETLAKGGTLLSIYKFASQYWFAWANRVNAVPGPIAGDTQNRTYFTGVPAGPQMTYAGPATSSGDGKYPSVSYDLGLPAPASACTATLVGDPTDPTDLPETRIYVYTFLSSLGEEGPPSPASNSLDWRPGQTVDLSGMVTVPTGNFEVTGKRVYRTDYNGTFRVVGDMGTGTTFSDTVSDAALGEELPSLDWGQPPADMLGLIAIPNGVLAGYSKNTVCFCEPYMPHAWPVAYQQAVEYPIVGLGSFAQSIAVVTTAHPYVITGTDPRAMTVEKIEIPYPGLSAASVVDMGYGVAYASSDGLMVIGSDGVRNVTDPVLTRDQWQAMNPATMMGFRWQDAYVGFYTGGAFIIDANAQQFTAIDLTATGGVADAESGDLYFVNGADLSQFGQGVALSATWTSKIWTFEKPLNFACAKVTGTGTITFTLTGDGVQRFTGSVPVGKFFHLPGGYRATEWQVTLSGDVDTFAMAESSAELLQVP